MIAYIKVWLHACLWLIRHWRGGYKAEECVAIAPFVSNSDICVDIGAHAGSWSVPLARMVRDGRVYAFEALPHYAQALRRLMQLTGTANVTVINAALSDKAGIVQIAWRTKAGRKLTGNTHLATPGELKDVECVNVPAMTLDEWSARLPPRSKVSFVKIDVEGAELLIVRGATAFIRKNRPIIFMEIVTESCARYDYLPEELFRLFEGIGYRSFTVNSRSDRELLQPVNALNYLGHGDVLLVPAERSVPGSLH